MIKRVIKKRRQYHGWNLGQLITAGVFILVLGVFVGIMVVEGSDTRKRVHAVESIFSTHALEIAGEFRCSCGTCGEKNLAICTCETALIEKRYIENSLKAGKPHEQITQEMIKIYGFHNGS